MEEASAQKATLDEVLWRRVVGLAAAPRRLLEVVAVSGKPLRRRDACQAAVLGAEEQAALAVLTVGRLIRSTGPGELEEVETYHDRIRETVVAHLPPEQVRDHHGRLASVLEASAGADPETLAAHFEGAGDASRAGHYFTAAADRATEALAFDRAAQLYRHALELRPPEGAAVRELHVRLGDALANAGRGAEAAHEYEAACAAGGDPDQTLDLRRRIAYQYCISGRLNEGRKALATVLAAVGLTLPATSRQSFARLLVARFRLWLRGLRYRACNAARIDPRQLQRIDVSWSASAGLSLFDFIGAAGLQAHNLLLALRGRIVPSGAALAWEAAHRSNAGGPTGGRAARLLDEAEALARRIEQPYARGLVVLARGAAEFTSGRWKSAVPFLEQAEQTFRDGCTGVAWERDTAHVFLLWSLFYLGELADMGRRTDLLLQEARQRGDLYAATHLGVFSGPMARLSAGDADGARQLLDESLRQWSPQGFHLQHLTGLMCQTYLDLYAGAGASAWQRLVRQWPAVARSHFLRAQTLRVLFWDLRARSALAAATEQGRRARGDSEPRALASGAASLANARGSDRPSTLLRAAEGDARRIAREKMPWSTPIAELLRAGLDVARGDRASALERLGRATAGFDAADMALFAAVARRRRGELLGDAGRELLDAADAWMRSRHIHDPARMTATFAPGFPSPTDGTPAKEKF